MRDSAPSIQDGVRTRLPPSSNFCGERETEQAEEIHQGLEKASVDTNSTEEQKKVKDTSKIRSSQCGKLCLWNRRDIGDSKPKGDQSDISRT